MATASTTKRSSNEKARGTGKNRPEKSFRGDRGVRVSVFANPVSFKDGNERTFLKAVTGKALALGNGRFKTVHGYSLNELKILRDKIDEAIEFMSEQLDVNE